MAKFGKKLSPEAQKINESLDQAERLLQDKIYELGQFFYMENVDKADVAPQYREKMDLITRLESNRMGFYKEKLRLEGLMVCENCGATIPYGSVFCSGCGKQASSQPIAPAYAPQPAAPAYAPQPAAPAYAPQPAAPAYAPQPAAPAYAPQPAAPVYDSTVTMDTYAEQPVSGGLTPPSDNDMPKAGFGKMVPGQIEQDMMNAQQTPAERICPSCGEVLEADSVFCANCGTRV